MGCFTVAPHRASGNVNFFKKLMIRPGTKVSLKDIDPAWHGKHSSHDEAVSEIAANLQRLDRLQYRMYAEGRHSLLIVLQGLDSAGKDGVIRHVLSGVNPQGRTVASFKAPTREEMAHDFLWRIHPHAPRRGQIAIFNRSHYEDILVPTVHQTIPADQLSNRFEQINDFERLLTTANHTTILKFFLHISKDEQLARFKGRLDDPARTWKISESDYTEREFWSSYQDAYEAILQKTSTKSAPWFVIPANHKWLRDLAISHIIADAMDAMTMQLPAATVDLVEIRQKYHRASAEQRASQAQAKQR